jgi:predicted CXXCH cytochrome family protein
MSHQHVHRLAHWAAVAAALVSIAACTENKVVYRDRVQFPDPPAAAKGFMGYVSNTDKQTVCGTCHVGTQVAWEQTAHADAWASLQTSDHAADYCEGCHTTGQLGNYTADAQVGWTSTKDDRYYDVQCESCHGAGLGHIENPEVSANRPLAMAAVDATMQGTYGCGSCHNGEHHPYVEEWAAGMHGAMHYTSEDPGHIVTNSSCQACHTGEGALKKFGVTGSFVENGKVPSETDFMRITCVVCHDPHGGQFEGQLRLAVDNPVPAQNLCLSCHNRRATPDISSFRGPHSAVGMLLIGDQVGWRPPGMTTDPIFGTHGDPAVNTKLCASCHVVKRETTNDAGETAYSTGHLFVATPWVDAEGRMLPHEEEGAVRTFRSCVGSGCHSSENGAAALIARSEERLNAKLAELKALLENTANVPCAEFKTLAAGSDPSLLTVARGARYNYLLAVGHAAMPETDACSATQTGAPQIRTLPPPIADEGAAVHNPFVIEVLLQKSVEAVKARYYPGMP